MSHLAGLQRVRSGELLYTDEVGRDACGIGGVAARDGKPSAEVMQKTLNALRCMEHRGGVCGDAGDGAGLTAAIPQAFFKEEAKYPTAECYIINAQRLFPHDLYLWSMMGLNQYFRGDFASAATNFEYVVEKDPNNAEAYYNLGLTRVSMKEYDKALAAASRRSKELAG